MTVVGPEEEEEHLEVKEDKVDLAVPAVVVRLVFIVSIQILGLQYKILQLMSLE